uniref:hypothetical protein n=1 Tax=Acidaminococcus intestini TaxID=187327 RepID=UPI003AB412D5
VFANSDENLKEAVRRIADYVARAYGKSEWFYWWEHEKVPLCHAFFQWTNGIDGASVHVIRS